VSAIYVTLKKANYYNTELKIHVSTIFYVCKFIMK